MTEASVPDAPAAAAPKPVLGIGQIISDVLVLLVRRLPKVLCLALPGAGLSAGFLYLVFETLDANAALRSGFSVQIAIALSPVLIACTLGLGLGLGAAPLAAGWSSWSRSRTLPLGPSLWQIRRKPVHAALAGLIVCVLAALPLCGALLLTNGFLGGFLTLCAMLVGTLALGIWGPALPAISMDNLGLGALRRSAELTRDYRMATAGTCALMFLTASLLGGLMAAGLALAFALIFEFWLEMSLPSVLEQVLVIGDALISSACMIGTFGLGLAAIRARLVEIKEPPDIADMVDVFD